MILFFYVITPPPFVTPSSAWQSTATQEFLVSRGLPRGARSDEGGEDPSSITKKKVTANLQSPFLKTL